MGSLRINLFGEFRVRCEEAFIESKEWDRQKTRSLLKPLLTRPDNISSRDEVVKALWPGVSPKAAEKTAEEGKLSCEYEAPSAELLFEHAQSANLPLDRAQVVQELEPAMFR